ncbi:hypothetical protein CAOG_07340 [Capsaspora owczarzaki ATCC 30864]|uniref:MICOS complex subunit MIC10 n=1 Tax=Capsaspora owczarzaki (strain ATCC 30864) TaxID=595528 RepID=A0A0D2WWT3_CAPO3|nr:hypothetical protein CAOG_07340 [Capsaspora owczarzaki ATCC 30864]KJE97490.1 hypothetical protein CAOG_007340 [Capsaspora owczarzaki ATCC 30864]|eukprot:XP_004343199.1 hypothetical protein CAOG_07340 [Capsaspora owczarzaki ATCC 30864]
MSSDITTTESKQQQQIASEAQLGAKWDRCFTNMLVHTGVGAGVGIVLSLIFFKRRMAPVYLSTGFAIGTAYQQCQDDFASARATGKVVRISEAALQQFVQQQEKQQKQQ